MKILHGHVGSEISVRVLDPAATPEDPLGYEFVPDHGFFARHGDSSFAVDPDGTLYVYGDMSKPPHHSYRPQEWAWVGDENNNGAFNTTLPAEAHRFGSRYLAPPIP